MVSTSLKYRHPMGPLKLGDLIDVAYKANLKTLTLLEAAAEKKLRREGSQPR